VLAGGLDWLADAALREADGTGRLADDRLGLRAMEAVLLHATATGSGRTRAQELLRRLMASSLRALAGPAPHGLEQFERFAAAQYLLAEAAPRVGLHDEAARYLTEARAHLTPWASSLADGLRELDGVFAVAQALLELPASAAAQAQGASAR
jgi:hypothetical protein